MTVSTVSNKIEYIANGTTGSFAYDFPVLDETHMQVYFGDQLQTSGFTVLGIGNPDGGEVVFDVDPIGGTEITLIRVVPFTQEIEYDPYGRFPAKTLELGLDLDTMRIQQLAEAQERSLVSPIGGGAFDAKGERIINLGGHVDPTDAVNAQGVVDIINQSSVSGGSIISEAPPALPIDGQRWTRCSDMISFIWYEDADGGQWVEDNPSMGADFEEIKDAISSEFDRTFPNVDTMVAFNGHQEGNTVAYTNTMNELVSGVVVAAGTGVANGYNFIDLPASNLQFKAFNKYQIDSERTDFVKKALAQTWVGRGYVKAAANGTDFRVGFELQGYKAVEYFINNSPDNFLWVDGVYTGEQITAYILPELTGNFIQSTTGNKYTSTIGASFSFTFDGTGLYLNAYTDTRGGVWNFSIDGGADIPVSTWTSETIESNSLLVTDSLSDGTHSVVATYAGADPLNPPSSGGNGRGWLKYDNAGTGVSTATPIPLISGYPTDKAIELNFGKTTYQAMAAGTVLDFAIRASAVGSGFSKQWVPSHSSSVGSTQDITLEIYVDGLLISNTPSDIVGNLIFNDSLVFKQTYTAYNYQDTGKLYPLWSGTFVRKFKDGLMTTDHTIKILNDTEVDAGYLCGMLAAKTPVMNTVKYNSGFEKNPLADWSGVANNYVQYDLPNSACYQSDDGAFSAVTNNLTEVLSSNVADYSRNAVYVQSRTDTLIKSYWTSFSNTVLQQGDVYRATSNYAVLADVSIVL